MIDTPRMQSPLMACRPRISCPARLVFSGDAPAKPAMMNSTVCMISRPSGIAVNPISRPGALAIAAAAMHSRHSTGSTIRPFI